MIVRIFLLLLFLGCFFSAFFLFNDFPKHKICGVILSTIGVMIFGLFIFTFGEIDLTIQTKIDKEAVIKHISNNPNGIYECPLTYEVDDDIGTESFGMYQIIKIETNGPLSQKEIEKLFLDKIDELRFEDIMIGTSELENRMYRYLCSSLTTVSEDNDVTFYFFPTLAEPYSPRSFLFKGCTYSYCYRNFFAWHYNNVIYVYMEMCDTSNGKTLTGSDRTEDASVSDQSGNAGTVIDTE